MSSPTALGAFLVVSFLRYHGQAEPPTGLGRPPRLDWRGVRVTVRVATAGSCTPALCTLAVRATIVSGHVYEAVLGDW